MKPPGIAARHHGRTSRQDVRPFSCARGLVLAAGLMIAGCAAPPITEPAAVVLDRDASLARRHAALTTLVEDGAAPGRWEALHALLWSDAQPAEMRLTALDALAADDVEDLAAVAAQRIVEVDRWEVLRPLLERGTADRWPGWATAVIRSWARPSQVYADADRPELALLARLASGDDIKAGLFGYVAGRWGDGRLGDRVVAWELLVRLASESQLRIWLNQAEHEHEQRADLLMDALRHAASSLGELPATRQQAVWLLALDALPAASVTDVADRPALRHLALVTDTPPGRGELLSTLRRRLADGPAAQRIEGGVAQPTPVDESLAAHVDRLSRYDLAAIAALLDDLADPQLVRAWFVQADADLADPATEYGGVLTRDAAGRVVAHGMAPMARLHDHAYIPPAAVITVLQSPTGLAHYHFHAQQHHNAPWAGPGAGDLAFADRYGLTCLVLTFLDRDTLDVDYYQPGGIVVDLGVVRREGRGGAGSDR